VHVVELVVVEKEVFARLPIARGRGRSIPHRDVALGVVCRDFETKMVPANKSESTTGM
jgi:hypothetical protein